jgi:hypothetical protein
VKQYEVDNPGKLVPLADEPKAMTTGDLLAKVVEGHDGGMIKRADPQDPACLPALKKIMAVCTIMRFPVELRRQIVLKASEYLILLFIARPLTVHRPLVDAGFNLLDSKGSGYKLVIQDLPKHLADQGFILINYPSQRPLPDHELVGPKQGGLASCPKSWQVAMLHQCSDSEYPIHFVALRDPSEKSSKFLLFYSSTVD